MKKIESQVDQYKESITKIWYLIIANTQLTPLDFNYRSDNYVKFNYLKEILMKEYLLCAYTVLEQLLVFTCSKLLRFEPKRLHGFFTQRGRFVVLNTTKIILN